MSDFSHRHIGPSSTEIQLMLDSVGYESLDRLIENAVPRSILIEDPLELPEAMSEIEVLQHLRELANKNVNAISLIGQGYYNTITPSVIQRNVLENPAWYTSYTPYQPEISQGRLEALLNFQTMISELTGMDIAGASLLDEPTAVAEAMTLLKRVSSKDSNVILIDQDTHPQILNVVKTRALPLGIDVRVEDVEQMKFKDAYAVVLSYPTSSGLIRNIGPIIETAHQNDCMVAVTADLLSLTVLESPGQLGADVVTGSAQRFGVPMGFGGPHAGFIAVKKGFERSLPGRLVGVSVDAHGNTAYRLALQTREQHIRRDKATSNICTAQALLAIISAMYASYHGFEGLQNIAFRVHEIARKFEFSLIESHIIPIHKEFFDTVAFKVFNADEYVRKALSVNINIRKISSDVVSVSFDETSTLETAKVLLEAWGVPFVDRKIELENKRSTQALDHPVFTQYQSETEMMRYLRKLSDKDLALDRTMIPLGSCTMKLNAATEMAAITWPEFANAHPFAPENQNIGWRTLIQSLEDYLCEVTGYDRVSLQPNAGSQGEFAGLLAISKFHKSNGENDRTICLIPSSAHGTNAASAVMAGMQVVVINCDAEGNVELEDIEAKIQQFGKRIAAIMVTYPSTHGVFEDGITMICQKMHEIGAQVYVDGANLNALVGIAKPGKFGADVSHLNLHKTFCIPHGGGGPGVGPVAVRSHLAPFLPTHSVDAEIGAISGAPFGSAGILPIPYAYIRMMSSTGLRTATEVAILSANYIAKKLEDHFPILYSNKAGLVAHECIVDVRPLTKSSGVTVDDIAKRLIDFGFHAPTMSFPVAGTLMIEPTESESLTEINRFVEAMVSIRNEIRDVEEGRVSLEDSPLTSAPHTALSLLASDRSKEARLMAGFPNGAVSKYWPPVGRIDGAYGDRNLTCACPPIEELALENF
ncbi:MAG: aminomethyl-transferring glycine dehydrogenase [Candidatus Nanopelagicales bacterium]